MEAAARDVKGFQRFDVLRLANGRLELPNNRGLWRQTAGCNALTASACGRKQSRGMLRVLSVVGVLRLANSRLERSKNRGLWRQTAGCNALTTNACGQSAWWKQRSNNKCLWPECLVEAAARDVKGFKRFRGFKAGKQQAGTL